MRFLNNLLYSKRPSSKTLLDIALILSILPHLFMMKFFMIFYLLFAIIFIVKQKKHSFTPYIFMLLGIVLIIINFFDDYNFSNLSKMSFFISLISTLLVYVVTLQKLTGVINIYLRISPVLLLLLSFFFFDTITMLLYSSFVFFAFVLMFIWVRMDAPFIEVLKKTSQLFLLSAPSVIILFLVFPRISFDKAEFGFRGDTYTTSGYDGVMHVSSKEIRLSQKMIMEVSFNDTNISDDALYFRGSTLSHYNNFQWQRPEHFTAQDNLVKRQDFITYNITLYPHADHWIYALDMPLVTPPRSQRDGDFTLRTKKKIYEKKRYQLRSALKYKLTTKILDQYLEIDQTQASAISQLFKDLIPQDVSNKEKASLLVKFFQNQNLSYTLKPLNIDEKNFTYTFLSKGKNGYCVHFASAFASSARVLGIPSRVVTGFKPHKDSMMNNYLLVKASDAHAWVELYFEDDGWVRYDPTKYASQTLDTLQDNAQLGKKDGIFDYINLSYMYVKYTIENWILDYNRIKQMDILNKLLSDIIYFLKFAFSLLASFALLFLLYLNLKKSNSKDALTLEMDKLMKLLREKNIEKKDDETMEHFLNRVEQNLNISLFEINKYYHILKYSKNEKGYKIRILKKKIQMLKDKL